MNSVVINFSQAKLALKAKNQLALNDAWRANTLSFVENLTNLVAETEIDPLHKATLLMAKAVDVLSAAGPVPNSVDEENLRAKQLLHTISLARVKNYEPSVRIISDPSSDANLRSI